jgi:heme/copper-type cytochrome/quinol oxidase subunit 2
MHILAHAEEHAAITIWDTYPYALVAIGIFSLLAFVTWSYRDVANRHDHKSDKSQGHH